MMLKVRDGKKTSSELRKTLEKLGLHPRRELMNITSNLHITIDYLDEHSGNTDEELQSFLSS